MTVSVVIATYNRAAMVRQAVEAALAQSRTPDEVIVMDDASTDGTAETLAELAAAHPTVRTFRRAANSGGVGSWNEATALARGDYIAFCTDDDRFLPSHLEASIAYLEEHPEVGLVHSHFIDMIESAGEQTFEQRPLRSNQPLRTGRSELLRFMTRYYNWPFHASTLVLRRTVWVNSGGYNPVYALADTDWFVRVVEQSPAVLLPRYGVYNRRHAGNWSNRLGSARMQREIFEIVEDAIARLCAGPTRSDALWGAMRRAAWRAVWRTNVRMHLLLTMRARLRTGHADAACAAWTGVLRNTGLALPSWINWAWNDRAWLDCGWIERAGADWLRRRCRGREAAAATARERVSPL
jgi:glycosyltransferase involved in cell wall biosynthesis